ncbi:MAG: glycosyltransferase family 39 protein, partial [Acidimicrobiales bacterium]|nr:glycosyltransferase family 39 protein [Acidimicrobiales bacterium]
MRWTTLEHVSGPPPPVVAVRHRHVGAEGEARIRAQEGPADPSVVPSRSRRASDVVSAAGVIACLGVGVVLRAWLLSHRPINSDEAIVGLMANQILHGHFFAFYWGQHYGGVEPYAVAAVFAVFGQSPLTLDLTPVLLSCVAAILVWRIALRLVRDRRLAAMAGALAWAVPFPTVFQSTVEGGFRGVVSVCGLGVCLAALRILDGHRRYRDFVALGLVAGLGWWAVPEIVYFFVPGLVLLAGAVRRRPRTGPRWWALRLGASAVAFAVGALPWLWVNLGSGFVSLRSKGFAGATSPYNHGYGSRLVTFFQSALPLQLDLRRLE